VREEIPENEGYISKKYYNSKKYFRKFKKEVDFYFQGV